MDSELRFISTLLRANKANQESFFAQQIPRGVFKLREIEINWIYKFRQQYNCYPSPKAFFDKFKEQLPVVKDPLPATLQPILDLAMFNQMNSLAQEVKKQIDSGGEITSALSLFKEGAARLNSYSVDYADHSFATNPNAIVRYRKMVSDIAHKRLRMVQTPWPAMNKMIGYLRPGNTVVMAARMGMGKSWTTMFWADYVANLKIPTLYVTKEMPTEEATDRFEALRYHIPYTSLTRGELSPTQIKFWHYRKKFLAKHPENYPLIISGDETVEGVGVRHVVAKIIQYKPEFVIIDGAYLLSVEGMPKNANRVEVLSKISSQLKAAAKTLHTIIIIVIQMNRKAEKPDGTAKGGIADLYGADTWAQDADVVMDLGGKRGSNSRIINILKSRNSGIGEFNIEYKLDPCPSFKQISSVTSSPGSSVTFTPL